MSSIEENKRVVKILSEIRSRVEVRANQILKREKEARARKSLYPESRAETGWVRHWVLERAGNDVVLSLLNDAISSRTEQVPKK